MLKRNWTHHDMNWFYDFWAALEAFSFLLLKASNLQMASKSTWSVVYSRTWILTKPNVFLVVIFNIFFENLGLDYIAGGPYFVLLRSVCYSCFCAIKASRTTLDTGAALQHLCGSNVQGPKLRASCGVHGCLLWVRDCPTIQGLPPLQLFSKNMNNFRFK